MCKANVFCPPCSGQWWCWWFSWWWELYSWGTWCKDIWRTPPSKLQRKEKTFHVFLFDRIQSRFVTFCGSSFAWYIWIHLMYNLTIFDCVLENDLYSKHFACFGVYFLNRYISYFQWVPWTPIFVQSFLISCSVARPGKDSDNDLLDKEWVWIHYGTAAGMKSEFPTLDVEDFTL